MGLNDEIDGCVVLLWRLITVVQWHEFAGARSTLCTCITGSWRKFVVSCQQALLPLELCSEGCIQSAYSEIATRCGMQRSCDSFTPKNVYFFTVVFISLLPWFLLLLLWEVCNAHCSVEIGAEDHWVAWMAWSDRLIRWNVSKWCLSSVQYLNGVVWMPLKCWSLPLQSTSR